MGVLADKDFRGIFDPIVPLAERIAAVTPDSPRALPAAELCRKLAGEYGFTAAAPYPNAAAALAALLAERIAAVTPDSPRALPAAELCRKLAGEYGFTAAAPYPNAAAALAALRESVGPEDVICVCGSLYMIGEVRTLLGLP